MHEINTKLGYQSDSEYIYKSNGDSVYFQHKDESGRWINMADLLDTHLPTDRLLPKEFTFIIPEGTTDIRFISNINKSIIVVNKLM